MMSGPRPSRLAGLAGIGVDQVGSRADTFSGADVLRLENLDTDVRPNPAAVAATQAAIAEDKNNSYLPFVGQFRLRQAVAGHVSRLSGVSYTGERNVLISAGGLSGILNVLLAIIDAGDEVVLTDPTYVGLINRVRLAGGVPRLVPFARSGREWVLDRDALQQAVTDKTRAFLLMSPSMPSGGYLGPEDWEAVATLVRERQVWLINDAAMERILFDGRRLISPAALPGMADYVITVGAAAKELRMIGWRVGWIVAPARLVPDLALVSMGNVVVPVGIGQEGVAVALELGDADVAAATKIWEARRDVLLAELEGLPVVRPAGGWSLLLDGTELGMTGAAMSERLLMDAHVAATPMDGWGVRHGPQHLRFVFANEPVERLTGIGPRIRRALGVDLS